MVLAAQFYELFQLHFGILDPGQSHPRAIPNRVVALGGRKTPDIGLDIGDQVQKVQDLGDSGRIEGQVFGKGEAGESRGGVQLLLQLMGSLEEPLNWRRMGWLVAPLVAFDDRRLRGEEYSNFALGHTYLADFRDVDQRNKAGKSVSGI